jgi:hypothetical protein
MTFQESITIAAPADYLFDLTQNYRFRSAWDPFLLFSVPLASPWLSNGTWVPPVSTFPAPDIGVCVRCVSRYGVRMDVQYVSYQPPRVAAVKMIGGAPYLRRFAGTWLFEERAPEETRVIFKYHVVGRPRVLTRLLGWLFARESRKRLRALKAYVEAKLQPVGRITLQPFREE